MYRLCTDSVHSPTRSMSSKLRLPNPWKAELPESMSSKLRLRRCKLHKRKTKVRKVNQMNQMNQVNQVNKVSKLAQLDRA